MKFFTLIKGETIHPAPGKKILPKKEFSTLMEAKEILEMVQTQAQEYKIEISKECEILKEKAEEEGFEKGLNQWSQQLTFLKKEIQTVREDIQKTLVPLALTVVKKIVGREVETNQQTILDIIKTALKGVSQCQKVTLYVHPQELEIIEKKRPEIKKIFERLEVLKIMAREDIAKHGCIIETESGIINAQLDNQLKALEAAFQTVLQNTEG